MNSTGCREASGFFVGQARPLPHLTRVRAARHKGRMILGRATSLTCKKSPYPGIKDLRAL